MKGQILSSDSDKRGNRRAWDLAILFLQGQQWLSYDVNLGRYELSRPRSGANVHATVNLLLNMYRNILSRLTINYPSIAVVPATPAPDDVTKAKATELFLEYHWSADELKNTLSLGFSYLLSMGTCALHTYYDPGKKRVTTDAHSAYDIFFEAGVSMPDESEWTAIRTYHTKAALKKAYPDHSKKIDEASMTRLDDRPTGQAIPADRVELYEIYWRDGRHGILMGDTYLFKEEDALVDPFPIQIIRYTVVPTRLWGLGLIEPLVDLQWYYNKARSQVIQNAELMANPKILIPKTAGVPTNSFTDRPGEKIYYNATGGKPEMMVPSPLPGYIMDNMSRIQAEMGDVAGIHSVSLGRRAVNVSSGAAIAELASKDLSQLEITQSFIEDAAKNVAKLVCLLAKAHYSEGKYVKMMDEYGSVIHREIQNEDIVDNPEIFIQAGSLFRKEAHDRDAKVLELFNLGLIDKEQAMYELSFRTSNAQVSEKVQALAHAQEILDGVKRGMMVEIYATDDLDAFSRVFKDFMRSDEFYTMPVEMQDYVSDVYTSIIAFGKGQQAYQMGMTQRKVFPREIEAGTSMQQTAMESALPESNIAQQQVGGEAVRNASEALAVEDSVSRMAAGTEANISPFGGQL
jgi:hypothetical protein